MARAVLIITTLVISGCSTSLQQLYRQTLEVPWADASYVPSTRDDCQQGMAVLELRAATLRTTIHYGGLPEGAAGTFTYETRQIHLMDGLTSCGKLEVLAHELGHVMAPPILINTPYGQVYADGVSFLVVEGLARYSPRMAYAKYLAGGKLAAPTLEIYRRDIERTAHWLVTGR